MPGYRANFRCGFSNFLARGCLMIFPTMLLFRAVIISQSFLGELIDEVKKDHFPRVWRPLEHVFTSDFFETIEHHFYCKRMGNERQKQ